MMKKEIKTMYELHELSINYMRELEFMQDEQSFLEHLLSSHFLELSSEELFETTRKLIKKLKEVEGMGVELIDELTIFDQWMASSVHDEKDQSTTEISRKLRFFQKDFNHYVLKFKYVKKKIFSLIKEIMKSHKQKLLLK
ncbi:hypothetical protein [Lutimonas sp.]|uniref:hypothetical protein n=1 Tax=Lutimonas sp. TaxID=1872403 RepID=UPI003D9B8008